MPMKPADKPPTVTIQAPTPVSPVSVPPLTKNTPNDLYRKLLPAVLFLLTFVTVMTMLLIYMDTVALGAQQFRLNMSRDYELARIPQDSAALVAYVRQLHLAPRPLQPAAPSPPPPTSRALLLQAYMPHVINGTFMEVFPRGPRDPTTQYLELAEHWDGVVVRAAARDYLALRAGTRALHACLSPTNHPREVSYHEAEAEGGAAAGVFRSRVLCLPLYTLAAAAGATSAHYTALRGAALPALHHVPWDRVSFKVLDIRSSDAAYLNKTTEFLATKNYTVLQTFDDGIMYALREP